MKTPLISQNDPFALPSSSLQRGSCRTCSGAIGRFEPPGLLSISRTRPEGISLIEILVVIVIIGVLAAVVVPNVMSRPDEARVVAAKQDFATLSQALELYRLDNFQYPTDAQGLQALVERPTVAPIPPNWRAGGYIKKAPLDPWGQAYSYQRSPDGLSFEIRSLGADGAQGGEGVAADLSSKGL